MTPLLGLKDDVTNFMHALEYYINRNIAIRAKHGISEDDIDELVRIKGKLGARLLKILEKVHDRTG